MITSSTERMRLKRVRMLATWPAVRPVNGLRGGVLAGMQRGYLLEREILSLQPAGCS